jgi:HTH-type transcriptional regulator/antitoxin HigA
MTAFPHELQHHWTAISPLLSIRNEHEYDLAVERLNRLLDEVGIDEQHPLYTFSDTLGTLIHAYEEEHHPIPECSGADVLRFLMEEQGLTQSGLPEIGSQGVVSEILRGKRELNVRQIRALAARFHV